MQEGDSMTKLSAAKVKALRETGRYGDGGGLYLVVRASGSKSWVLRSVLDGRRRDLGLGGYPATGLAQARAKALDLKSALADGKRPVPEERKSSVPTVSDATLAVIELNRPRWKSAKYATNWLQMLERHAFPTLGDVRIDRVSRIDVLSVLTPIWVELPETARRIRQRLRAIFSWAISHGYYSDPNPAGEVLDGALPRLPQVRQHLRALPYSEVAQAIETVDASTASLSSTLCLRFLVLTAARSGEARGAVWNEVDVEGKVWTIPAARMKGGELHRVPMSRQALEVLEAARPLRDRSGLVFPSPTIQDRELSDMTLMKVLRSIGLAERATVHGFRTSFRTWTLEQTDAPWAVAEAALAHGLGNQVEKSYARSDLFDRRRELMQAWADYVILA